MAEAPQELGAALLTIDELALSTGLTVRTTRYYASLGLLPTPVRKGRMAYYGPSHLARLRNCPRHPLQAQRRRVAGRARSLLMRCSTARVRTSRPPRSLTGATSGRSRSGWLIYSCRGGHWTAHLMSPTPFSCPSSIAGIGSRWRPWTST